MALTKTLTTEYGIEVPGAYIRIESISMDKSKAFASAAMYFDNTKPAFSNYNFSFAYNLEGENAFSQAYEHLKTLPEFADATDC